MKLKQDFIQLPLRFDVQKLQSEAAQFSELEWDAHPQGYQGNSSVILVSDGGGRNNNYTGHMKATSALQRCPYIQQVIGSFKSVVGRSRLMRLEPGTEVPPHSDVDYSWRHRVRIHIPIITDEFVRFETVGRSAVNMKPGEAWVFDNWREHAVYNRGSTRRVHLVIDTTGSSEFWRMISASVDSNESESVKSNYVDFNDRMQPELQFEQFNAIGIRSPGDVDNVLSEFIDEMTETIESDANFGGALLGFINDFRFDWRQLWALYSDQPVGLARYQKRIRDLKENTTKILSDRKIPSIGVSAAKVFSDWIDTLVDSKIATQRYEVGVTESRYSAAMFDRPVFIVAAPRSGSTMLFDLLSQNIDFWTIGGESHTEFESIRSLHPSANRFASNALTESHATDQVINALLGAFLRSLKNSRGTLYSEIPAETRVAQFRFLEKTPKNALRIPFLRKIFPDAKFVFLHRNPRNNIASIMEAWQSGRFVTYPNLPGWTGPDWSLLLPTGWSELKGKSLAEIAAFQWAEANQTIYSDLQQIDAADWMAISYEDLLAHKGKSIQQLCAFADIPFGPRMKSMVTEPVPLSKYTVSKPSKDKWKRYEHEIMEVLTSIEEVKNLMEQLSSK